MKWAIAVSQFRSLRQAAEKLNMRQSTLSRRMRDLEQEVGATLFERTNGGARLTPAGQEFLEAARRIIEETELMVSRLKTRSRGESGRPPLRTTRRERPVTSATRSVPKRWTIWSSAPGTGGSEASRSISSLRRATASRLSTGWPSRKTGRDERLSRRHGIDARRSAKYKLGASIYASCEILPDSSNIRPDELNGYRFWRTFRTARACTKI
jgi:molybdenum-dependent DNA-binding transcriptional regulator ModE